MKSYDKNEKIPPFAYVQYASPWMAAVHPTLYSNATHVRVRDNVSSVALG
jgi:hypothetical protein